MINIENKLGLPQELEAILIKTAQAALSNQSQAEVELSIVLTDDAHLQDLNQQFLGLNEPTDVLSFPAAEIDPDREVVYLGDVLISYQRATVQAEMGGHAVEDELKLLVVHGLLHLLGYDHATPQDKAEMWQIQEDILQDLGVNLSPS